MRIRAGRTSLLGCEGIDYIHLWPGSAKRSRGICRLRAWACGQHRGALLLRSVGVGFDGPG